MDIYNYLKKDHELVSALMKKVVASNDSTQRLEIFEKIKFELTLHAKTEEKTFYAAIKKGTEKLKEKEKHAEHEHDEIEEYFEKLSGLKPEKAEWLITFGEFKHSVEHHVEEEEGDIFKLAKKVISKEEAVELAEEMDMLKKKMQAKIKNAA